LVQAATQRWKKCKKIKKQFGYSPSPVDPCLFTTIINAKLAFVTIYFDDECILSTAEVFHDVIKYLGKIFKVKYLRKVKHFVRCDIIESEDKNSIRIYQPKLIKQLEADYSKYIRTNREYATTSGPKQPYLLGVCRLFREVLLGRSNLCN
jgi:hypothetical protein